MSALPGTKSETSQDYGTAAMRTRLASAEIPSAKCTFQRRSDASTGSTIVAVAASRLIDASTSKQSGSIGAKGSAKPLTNNCRFTRAEQRASCDPERLRELPLATGRPSAVEPGSDRWAVGDLQEVVAIGVGNKWVLFA
jgi:hypothetical protein